MTCTWCPNEATAGGKLPQNANGKRYWLACATHENKISKLGLIPMLPRDIEQVMKREAKEAKAQ